MPDKPTLLEMAGLEVESGVSLFTGEPFVAICAIATDGTVMRGQLDPAAVEAQAIVHTQAAEAARHDAALFAELKDAAGLPEHLVGDIVSGVRDRRLAMMEDE